MSCSKDGYYTAHATILSTTSAAMWGNLVVGGIVGVMVDSSTGAGYRYYDPPKFTLTAVGGTPPQAGQVSPGIILLAPDAPAASTRPPPASVAAPAATQPVASTSGEPPAAPDAPASGLSRSRL
jgi:hypothetical protein